MPENQPEEGLKSYLLISWGWLDHPFTYPSHSAFGRSIRRHNGEAIIGLDALVTL